MASTDVRAVSGHYMFNLKNQIDMTTTEFHKIMAQKLPFISFGIDVVEGYMEQYPQLCPLSASDLSANQIDLFMDYVLSQDLCDEVEL